MVSPAIRIRWIDTTVLKIAFILQSLSYKEKNTLFLVYKHKLLL